MTARDGASEPVAGTGGHRRAGPDSVGQLEGGALPTDDRARAPVLHGADAWHGHGLNQPDAARHDAGVWAWWEAEIRSEQLEGLGAGKQREVDDSGHSGHRRRTTSRDQQPTGEQRAT